MDPATEDLIKRREIHFCNKDSSAHPAQAASQLLIDAAGIVDSKPLTSHCLEIHYDLNHITLQIIEDVLVEVGFRLHDSLFHKLGRALCYYAEETQLANMGRTHDQAQSTLDIFISCYEQRPHGCRDERPSHLRHYS